MRLILILLILALGAYFFWNDIFSSDASRRGDEADEEGLLIVEDPPEEDQLGPTEPPPEPPPTPREKDIRKLMADGAWSEAFERLEQEKEGAQSLAMRHACLINLDRGEEAEVCLERLVSGYGDTAQAVRAALLDMERGRQSLLEQRRLLGRVLGGVPRISSDDADRLVQAMRGMNANMKTSTKGLFKSEKYIVKPNDSLWGICNRMNNVRSINVEVGLLRLLNKIKGDVIYKDQALDIPSDKISIRVYKRNWLMVVFIGEMPLTAYRVGLGANESTPDGDFMIKTRLKNPDWYSETLGQIIPHGDSRNILGTRWLGFEAREDARGFGIHGTTDPDSIGKNESAGCIRMRNGDVEELFELIARETKVTVI